MTWLCSFDVGYGQGISRRKNYILYIIVINWTYLKPSLLDFIAVQVRFYRMLFTAFIVTCLVALLAPCRQA